MDRLQNKFGLDASNPEYKDTKDIYANKVVLKINKEEEEKEEAISTLRSFTWFVKNCIGRWQITI